MKRLSNRKVRNQLVEDGKIREIYIGKNESESVIVDKLHRVFPSNNSFVFLGVTSGKDLIPTMTATIKERQCWSSQMELICMLGQ